MTSFADINYIFCLPFNYSKYVSVEILHTLSDIKIWKGNKCFINQNKFCRNIRSDAENRQMLLFCKRVIDSFITRTMPPLTTAMLMFQVPMLLQGVPKKMQR